MSTGFSTVTASHLQDASGTVIANATISFYPVDNNGKSLSFRTGGTQGQTSSTPVSSTVTNGAFTVTLADTSMTSPVNIGYKVTVIDNVSGDSLLGPGYTCVQPTGDTWSFDSYQPNLAGQITVQLGPSGLSAYQVYQQNGGQLSQSAWITSLAGAAGQSAYQVAVANGYSGTQSQWLASLVGPPGGGLTAAQAVGVASPIAQQVENDIFAALATGPAITRSPNLFNAATATNSQLVLTSNGSTQGQSGFFASDFIAVVPGQLYTLCVADSSVGNSAYGVAFYDASQAFVAAGPGGPFSAGTQFAASSGAAFVRFCGGTATQYTQMVVKGTTVPGSYQGFGATTALRSDEVAYIASKDSEVIDRVFESLVSAQIALSPNLLNPAATSAGLLHTSDGSFEGNASYWASEFISVVPGQVYTICTADSGVANASYGGAFYDKSRNFIASGPGTPFTAATQTTAPANAVYFRFCGSTATLNTQMLVKGTTAPASYQAFGASVTNGVAGTKLGFWGDSITQLNYYQPLVLAELNAVQVWEDGRAGRTCMQAFEHYSTTNPTVYPIAPSAVNQGSGCDGNGMAGTANSGYGLGYTNSGTPGNTLAQDIANVDVMVGFMEMNDLGYVNIGQLAIGTPSDTATTNSACGGLRNYLEGIQKAKPGIKQIFVFPYQPTSNWPASLGFQMLGYAKTICASYGIPLVDLLSESGINSMNWSITLGDGLHITPGLGAQRVAPLIAAAIRKVM